MSKSGLYIGVLITGKGLHLYFVCPIRADVMAVLPIPMGLIPGMAHACRYIGDTYRSSHRSRNLCYRPYVWMLLPIYTKYVKNGVGHIGMDRTGVWHMCFVFISRHFAVGWNEGVSNGANHFATK